MATCEQNYEEVISDSPDTLPNEIILNIFSHLTLKDLGRCAQVSKNFCTIAYDKTLWTNILVTSGMIPNKLLEQALSRGAKYLGFSNLSDVSTLKSNFPSTNQVEYLALSSSLMDENYFRQLILSCHKLTKLSVPGPYGAWNSDDLIEGIVQNSNSLKVLDLSGCHKLDSQDLNSIVSVCLKLTDVNFDHMNLHTYNLSSIFTNLTPNIKKLSLSGAALRISDIANLITQCNKITDLNLNWALLLPERGHINFPRKTQLESLHLRGFDIKFNYLEMFIRSFEKSLQVLDISFCKKMTFEAIQLIISRCLNLTEVDFCELKYTTFICKNLTPNIEKVSFCSTDVSNEDIKTLVSRCNKIKELDISYTHVVIDAVVDEIILHLSSTLEKLSLSKFPFKFSQFKLGYMPKLKYLWTSPEFPMYGMEKMKDIWRKKNPDVVISSALKYEYGLIIPNIAKPMPMEKTIWEIKCEGIQLSDKKEEDSDVHNSEDN
jgi:F-box/leucine-rich repeat protein 14